MFMNWDFILRIFIAGILGGIIGIEREYRSKEAGLRTHFLVGLGSALFMILSHSGFGAILAEGSTNISLDPSRIASQVVTGIGFIGTGIIIFQKHVVRGLTTAAMYFIAVSATVMVLACLEMLYLLLRKFGRRNISLTLSSPSRKSIRLMVDAMRVEDMEINSYEVREEKPADSARFVVTMEVKMKGDRYEPRIIEFINRFDDIDIDKME